METATRPECLNCADRDRRIASLLDQRDDIRGTNADLRHALTAVTRQRDELADIVTDLRMRLGIHEGTR